MKFLKKNSLLLNSINLMLSIGVTAIFGFLFWVVIARTVDSSTVGLATTVLSISSLISLIGLAGFDTVLVKFLPKSKNRSEQINTGLVISGIVSVFFSALFCVFLPLLAPKVAFVDQNFLYVFIFIATTVLTTWNTLTSAILVAFKRTSYVVLANIAFSLVKLVLPFIFHGKSAITIVCYIGVAQAVNVILSVLLLARKLKYRPNIKIDIGILRQIFRYGSTVYIANSLNVLPDTVLPIIVVDKLGAAAAAYFYIAFTIANLLYSIAFSTVRFALFAEVSHDQKNMKEHVLRGIKIGTGLIVPASILLFVLCPIVLLVFGSNYSHGSENVLRILTASSILVLFYSLFDTIFKLTNRLSAILVNALTNALIIIILSIVLVGPYGLSGVGWAWLIGNAASCIVSLLFYRKEIKGLINAKRAKSLIKFI